MRRFWPLLIPIVLILVGGGYVGFWFYASERVRDGIDDWVAGQRAHGVDVRYRSVDIGGFPLKLEAEAHDFVVTRGDGAAWRGDDLEASALPWRLTRIDFALAGDHELTVPGVTAFTVTTRGGDGDLQLAPDGRLTAAQVSLSDVAVALPRGAGVVTLAGLDLAAEERPADESGLPDLAARGDARAIDLPASPLPALGLAIDHAGIDVTVTGPVPPVLNEPALAAWRDTGGELRIERLSLRWGPLVIEANGTIALDEALQPSGNLVAQVQGFLETVDALVEAGMIEAKDAGYTKAGLALLAGPPGPDGTATLTAPLRLRDRRLTLGPLPLAELPAIVWP